MSDQAIGLLISAIPKKRHFGLAHRVKRSTMFKKQFSEVEDACALAQAMVDTVREPLIVLDKDLRVIAASRSFYVKFTTNPDDSRGKHLYELGDGEWDFPRLRELLENIIPGHREIDDYEVEHDFPRIGKRVVLLNACIVLYEKAHKNILLSIEDVTVQRALEREKDELLRQKDVLLDEIEHRVANSLQIIASIIMLKAKSVDSEETRRHLHDAHNRVISVAAVQRHLHASAGLGSMEMLPYLSTLCGALTHSMIGDGESISLKVIGEGGSSTCANAESLGLIVTELVINALKHAFDKKTKKGANYRCIRRGGDRLEAFDSRQWYGQARRCFCPAEKRARNRHCQGPRKTTRRPGRNFERAKGNDRVGYSRHLRGPRGTIGCGPLNSSQTKCRRLSSGCPRRGLF
jgi:two-component sensor histidine kinase